MCWRNCARCTIETKFFDPLSAWDITIVPHRLSYNGIFSRTPAGIHDITPYQPEIAQGRLEALLNYQTMIADLTGLPLANASMLDEATAAAEAMTMCHRIVNRETDHETNGFFVAEDCHPQTIAVLQTRAEPLGIVLHIGRAEDADVRGQELFGLLLPDPRQPTARFTITAGWLSGLSVAGARVVVATDLLALTLLKPPGEWGADIAVGSSSDSAFRSDRKAALPPFYLRGKSMFGRCRGGWLASRRMRQGILRID